MSQVSAALNRFANIFWHYYRGPLLGFHHRLWPVEQEYSFASQLAAVALFLMQFGILLCVHVSPLLRLGLAMLLFSPQWLYVYPVPHPVFEFRAYGMAMGVALIIIALGFHPILLALIALLWFRHSVHRHQHITEPLRFWTQAQEEQHHGS